MTASVWSRRDFLATGLATGAVLMGGPAFGQPRDLAFLSLQEASELVRRKAVSPVELTEACLKRIKQLDKKLNAFITVTEEQALKQAADLKEELARGKWRGPLHGIPIALKDNIDTKDVLTTAASKVFAKRNPAEDAQVVQRLTAAGAILVGKTNMDEFAFGIRSVLSAYGPVANPWELDHIAGGSSGGSAAAVAAGLCFAALGSDTDGSIRVPAAFCGLVGLRPTYGRVSNRGLIPLAWTSDTVGPMCRTVADAAVVLQAIAGYDADDPASLEKPVPDYSAALREKPVALRLGKPRGVFYESLDGDIKAAIDEAIEELKRTKLVASVHDVDLPAIPELPLTFAEAYAYHAPYLEKSADLYLPEIRARIEMGKEIKVETYLQARRQFEQVRRDVRKVFATVDLLVTPTSPVLPLTIRDALNQERMAKVPPPELRNTLRWTIYGLPSLSIPCGFSEKSKLPIGLQVSGPPFGEAQVLALAHAFEQATEWHKRRPLLS